MPNLSRQDYFFGWICPLEIELLAATCMLDEKHDKLPTPATDPNSYTLGSIHGHNIVIAGLPATGNVFAATIVAHMRSTFPNVRFGLLVGIGGGVPATTDAGPVRLGHVVVSKPTGKHSGAIQYDHGKVKFGYFERTGFIQAPPIALLAAAQNLAVNCAMEDDDPLINTIKEKINTEKYGLRRFKYPGLSQDRLYKSDYEHPNPDLSCKDAICDDDMLVPRVDHTEVHDTGDYPQRVVVHRGTIASGEAVIRSGVTRDEIAEKDDVICFEMELAGASNDFPCLVIRGISDYCDSHKNDEWHGYAAAAAAAYARNLLKYMSIHDTRLEENKTEEQRKSTREQIIDIIKFPEIGLGRENIEEPYRSTCQWIFQNQDTEESVGWDSFPDWLQYGNGIYWIQGKAGAGKSTLMNYIYDHVKTQTLLKAWSGDEHILTPCFFFWNSGNQLQKSSEGLLRSLLYQVIKPDRFFEADRILPRMALMSAHWNETILRRVFLETCRLLKYFKVCFFVDGLDEFSGDWMKLFELLSDICRDGSIKVCVSSRPENVFNASFGTKPNLKVQDFTYNDMRKYVFGKMSLFSFTTAAGIQNSADFVNIVEYVCKKAVGVWAWVKFAVSTLIYGYSNWDSLEQLRARLEELPGDLHMLYVNMVDRVKPQYKKLCNRVLRILVAVEESPISAFATTFLELMLLHLTTSETSDIETYTCEEVRRACLVAKAQWSAASMGLIEFVEVHKPKLGATSSPLDTIPEEHANTPLGLLLATSATVRVVFSHKTVNTFAAQYLCSMEFPQDDMQAGSTDFHRRMEQACLKSSIWKLKKFSLVSGVSQFRDSLEDTYRFILLVIKHYYEFTDRKVPIETDEILNEIDILHEMLPFHKLLHTILNPKIFEGFLRLDSDWMGYLTFQGRFQYVIQRFAGYRNCHSDKDLGKATHLLGVALLNIAQVMSEQRIALILFLMKQGVDINHRIVPRGFNICTVWQVFLSYIGDNNFSESSKDKIYQCLNLFLQAGAPGNEIVEVEHRLDIVFSSIHVEDFSQQVSARFEATVLDLLRFRFGTEENAEVLSLIWSLEQRSAPSAAHYVGLTLGIGDREDPFSIQEPATPNTGLINVKAEWSALDELESLWDASWTQKLFSSRIPNVRSKIWATFHDRVRSAVQQAEIADMVGRFDMG